MPRPIRLTSAGSWHHVMNRGAGHQDVFVLDADRESFLELLSECRARWGLVTHCAVLMGNHFHLLLEDRGEQLSAAMRHLLGVYTQRFNKRHGRDGALMRGRFRSRLIDSESYLLEVVRYIHANPVEAGLVEHASKWTWSSHRHYLTQMRPDWLETADVLARFGGDTPAGRAALEQFVNARIPDEIRQQLDAERWSPILGAVDFVEEVRKSVRPNAPLNHVALQRFAAPTPDEVVSVIAERLGCSEEEVKRRRPPNPLGRRLAILICAQHLPATASEIGAVLGLRDTTVSSRAIHIRHALKDDEQRLLKELLDRLQLG